MKTAFIIVLFKTLKSEVGRLKKEIGEMGLNNYKLYFIDNTNDNRGFAAGVNEGIKQGLKDQVDLFVIANPDISLKGVNKEQLFAAGKRFDVWGLGFKQENQVYYGGKIDMLAGSGGLVNRKPQTRFSQTDFVSGSFMIIKKEVIKKTGFFDEEYFLYYEDVDFCLRAKKRGFKVGIDSESIYKHFEASKNNPQKNFYLAKSKSLFLKQRGTVIQKFYGLTKSYLKKRPFVFNYFSLNFSSFLNKLLHFLFFIILVRTLSTKDYGIYTLVWAQVGLLLPLLDFGTTSYGLIYLPTQTQRFSSVFSLRFFMSIVVFFVTLIMAFIFKYNSQILLYIFMTAFVIFSSMFSGSFLVLSSLKQKLYLVSITTIIFNFLLVLASILSLFFFKSLFFIFVIVFISYNLYSLVNFALLKKYVEDLRVTFDYQNWLKIIRKSVVFLLISLFAGFYFKLDVFLLNFLKGQSAVGIYSSGYKFLDALLLFAASYNVSVSPLLAKLKLSGKPQFTNKIKKDFILLGLFGLVLAVGVYLLAPIFLPFVLKGEYLRAIAVLRIVIFALPLILISSVFLNALYILDRAYVVVGIFIFQIIFNLTLNLIFIPKYSYFASSYITVIGEVLNSLITFYFFRKYVKKL